MASNVTLDAARAAATSCSRWSCAAARCAATCAARCARRSRTGASAPGRGFRRRVGWPPICRCRAASWPTPTTSSPPRATSSAAAPGTASSSTIADVRRDAGPAPATDAAPNGVADRLHRDDARYRAVPATRVVARDGAGPAATSRTRRSTTAITAAASSCGPRSASYLARVRGVRIEPRSDRHDPGLHPGARPAVRVLRARGATTMAFETPSPAVNAWPTVRASGLPHRAHRQSTPTASDDRLTAVRRRGDRRHARPPVPDRGGHDPCPPGGAGARGHARPRPPRHRGRLRRRVPLRPERHRRDPGARSRPRRPHRHGVQDARARGSGSAG